MDSFPSVGGTGVTPEQLLDAMGDGVVVYRGDTVRYANASFHDLVGCEDATEVDSSSLVHPGDRERLREYQRHRYGSEENPPERFEARLLAEDGTVRRCEFDVRTVTLDGGPATLAVIRDLTGHERGQSTDRRTRHALETLVDLYQELLGVVRAVVRRPEQGTVERTVCKRLVDTQLYDVAWFYDNSAAEPIAVAGVNPSTVNGLYESNGPIGDKRGPANRAITDGEIRIADSISPDEVGPGRVAAIPIGEDILYGVLLLFTDRVDAFGVDERAALDVFGEITGFVLTAIENRELLTSDAVIELVFEVTDKEFPLTRLATAIGDRIELEGLVSQPPVEHWFLSPHGSDIDGIAEVSGVVDVDRLDGSDGDDTIRVTIDGETCLGRATRAGTIVAGGTGTSQSSRVSLEVIGSALPRVSEVIRETYPYAELLRKREHSDVTRSTSHVLTVARDRLTDRQWRILQTAYHEGYFEWPRDRTGEDIAESLDIAQPTFHHHLRSGQRSLLDAVFGSAIDSESDGN